MLTSSDCQTCLQDCSSIIQLLDLWSAIGRAEVVVCNVFYDDVWASVLRTLSSLYKRNRKRDVQPWPERFRSLAGAQPWPFAFEPEAKLDAIKCHGASLDISAGMSPCSNASQNGLKRRTTFFNFWAHRGQVDVPSVPLDSP